MLRQPFFDARRNNGIGVQMGFDAARDCALFEMLAAICVGALVKVAIDQPWKKRRLGENVFDPHASD